MRIVSLFDGISGARVALERVGIPVEVYYASEIDKYAIQISKKNYPDIIQIGDVTKVNGNDYKDIDLLIFGSPCTSFSIAGKGEGFAGQSGLFFEALRILKEVKPKYFLMENVKMKKEWKDIISKELGVEPILINSNLLSAQNRPRLYWTNIPNVTQPVDKGILLKDIIEENVDVSYTLSDKLLDGFERKMERRKDMKSGFDNFNVRGLDDKVSTLTARYFKMSMSDPYVKFTKRYIQLDPKNKGNNSQSDRLHYMDGKCAALPATSGDSKTRLALIDYSEVSSTIDRQFLYRKLTPIECERLQTYPDNYTEGVSNTQRYKALGNSFTVDVIVHILSNIGD